MNKNIIIVFLSVAVVALTVGRFLQCSKCSLQQQNDEKIVAIASLLERMEAKLGSVESELVKAPSLVIPEPNTNENVEANAAVELARKANADGDYALAALYWQNAIEHAPPTDLLAILKEYSEAVFKSAEGDFSQYSDAVSLERMAAVAAVKVPPNDIPAAKELHTRCEVFRDSLLAIAEADTEESSEPELPPANPADEMAKAVEAILQEMREAINAYAPGDGKKPTDAEYKILQLSGVAESAMSQLWLLDRSGISEEMRGRIDSFPAKLNAAITDFNAKHDASIHVSIVRMAATPTPKQRGVAAVHQSNINFYTNQIARIADEAKALRGISAQDAAQKAIAALQNKIVGERRQQMNEYQNFVANCCKLAFDSWDDVMNTGPSGFGRVKKDNGFKDESDFIKQHVRKFARNVTLRQLRTQEDRRLIYAGDDLISEALQRKSGGPNYWDVKNEHKAFIVTAIYGLYRIDQSLLTPETSRLFNDVFGKYYEKMDSTRKVWSVRWMVEEPKVKLEDF